MRKADFTVTLAVSMMFLTTVAVPCFVGAEDQVDREIVDGKLDWIHLLASPPSAD